MDKLSNGANPESRHCVVCAVASMEKRRKEKKRRRTISKTYEAYISSCKRESKFRGQFHAWLK